MRCKDIQKFLIQLPDGELPKPKQEALSQHLAVCNECRSNWELDSIKGRLFHSARRSVWPPEDFPMRVLLALRAEKAERPTLWGQLGRMAEIFAPAFAMIVVLFLGVLLFVPPLTDGRQSAQEVYRDLFGPAEEEHLLIAERADITADRVVRNVLEGR